MKCEQQARWKSFVLVLSIGGLSACSDSNDTLIGEQQLGVAHAALTASTTIRRGAGGAVVDATINAQRMRQNYGDDRKLIVSKKNESLLRFDVSAIPPSAVIHSATLTLYMHGHDDGDEDDCERDSRDEDRGGFSAVPVKIHLANAGWAESRVTFAKFDQAFDHAVAGILLPAGKNTYKSIDLKAAVQAWVGGARANHGIVLRTTSRKRWAFASSENSRVSLRPLLTISYSTPDEHCAPNPCQNGGSCTNGWSGFTCSCAPGFTGTTCETDIDDCVADPCLNGGSCTDDVLGYTCGCAAGYAGDNCETNLDECTPNPCLFGGVCTDGVNAYSCECAIGYTGANCETLVDNCVSEPCLNDGTCTNGPGTYTCACPTGFSGPNCEVNNDDCVGSPCQNGGACSDGVNSYACSCAAGFSGTNCEDDIDECAGAPCQNGGTCDDGVNGYTCACAAGYTGDNCEVNIDDCVSHLCENGGVCVDGVDGFSCVCAAGYGGALCATNIDECSPNPCQNGGTCTDGVNTYSCDCQPGYTGTSCQTPPASDPCATVGGTSFQGTCYVYHAPTCTQGGNTTCTTAYEAEALCAATYTGGHLASVNSDAEYNHVGLEIDPTGAGNITAWIGAVSGPNGFGTVGNLTNDNTWTDGSVWGYTKWRTNTNEPNSPGPGICVQLWPINSVNINNWQCGGNCSGWNDGPCNLEVDFGYVCQFTP